MKKITLKAIVLLFFVGTLLGFSQSTINITSSGGSFPTEKWVSITTEVDGAGTQVWGQGDGTYGNGEGLINEDISITPGTYYVNCYDRYADGWDGTTINVTAYGSVIGNNGGASPDDGTNNDSTSSWEDPALELEASFEIVVPNPPSCNPPSGINATALGSTTADLEWVAGGTESSWNLEWKANVDFTPGNAEEDASTTVGTPVFNATGLTASTTYYLYYQADCGGGDTSPWVGPFSFTTYGDCSSMGTFDYANNSGPSDSVGFVVNTLGDEITLTFSAGSTESCCDDWFITDAADGSGNVIASGSGSIVGSYESTSGEISFYVDSDFSVTGTTFEYTVSCVTPSTDTPDYFNVQFPATGTIEVGDEFLVFAQVYEAGLTDASATPAAGIEAWIGYSEVDSSPDTVADWTWVPASTNPGFDFSQNNDEYSLDLGAEVGATGTYYYASRWSLNNGPFVYGGILADGSNGGEWGTGSFASGVLTVSPPANDDIASAIAITVDEGFCDGTNTNGSNTGATSSAEGVGSCFNGANADNDVWFTFTPSGTTAFVNVSTDFTGGTLVDTEMSVYSGTPGSLVELACSQDDGVTVLSNGFSWNSLITDLPVNVGETYYVQVAGFGTTSTGTFCLDVSTASCPAEAGTLTADVNPVQLAGSDVVISASEDTAPTVPGDYDVTYVLTSGANLVIEDAGANPSFTVDAVGDYTIHTLVAETTDNTDPNFLDLGVIVFGTTEAADVLNIVTTNNLCASLDVTGAPITVESCAADAGTLTADATPVELSGGTATISATEDTAPTVPTNYEITYVLTSGANLVIEDAGANPSFNVTTTGDYTIHTLVAETTDSTDPNYLDLGVVVFGTTEAADVLSIVTTNNLCAALDVTGASIVVDDPLSIGEENASASFTYYPNPVKNTLTLNAQNNIEQVTMYNMLGQEVLRATPKTVDSDLDMSQLQTGTYFVKVTIANSTETIRVIKE